MSFRSFAAQKTYWLLLHSLCFAQGVQQQPKKHASATRENARGRGAPSMLERCSQDTWLHLSSMLYTMLYIVVTDFPASSC